MGARGVILGTVLVAACASAPARDRVPAAPATPATIEARVVAEFEEAVKTSREAYVDLFDFAKVGELEVLLHPYDLAGRIPDLDDADRTRLAREDGTPYSPERERRNVGNFYPVLAQRTVGSGGCVAGPPRSEYGKLLGVPFAPLPPGTPPAYEVLRTHVNAWLAHGGVVGLRCAGGHGGLAIVYTTRASTRGYDLITIYDD